MERKTLTDEQIAQALESLDGWKHEGKTITKSLKFENFAAALAFVNQVGALAETADHHPDLTLGWGYATITLTTHDRGGVTDVDLALAGQIENNLA